MDEFDASVMATHAGTFRQFTTELLLRQFRNQLAAADTPEECWEVLRKTYRNFGIEEIRLQDWRAPLPPQRQSSPQSQFMDLPASTFRG